MTPSPKAIEAASLCYGRVKWWYSADDAIREIAIAITAAVEQEREEIAKAVMKLNIRYASQLIVAATIRARSEK